MENEGSLKDFQILKLLGQGAFGQVYMVKRKQDGRIYALKKVKMLGLKQKQKDNALNEIRILASLNDQYIIKFKQAFYDQASGFLCIVMEYASGGDLLKMVNNNIKSRTRIKQTEIWKAISNIAQGLKSLHQKKILHRDLKAANIFIGDGSYKLGDLNVSKVLKRGLAYTQTGTPYYASPEVWQDLPYDNKSDMWSFGCVLYEMAALQPPFKAQDLQGLYKKVKAGKFKPIPSCYSAELGQVIGSLLKIRPKDRPDCQTLLLHPQIYKHSGAQSNKGSNDVYSSELLKTIKFNPYNLNALKGRLPKSSYENQETIKGFSKDKQSKYSKDSTQHQRQRILSACGVRRDYGLSPTASKKQVQKPKNYYPMPIQQGTKGLPPRPGNPVNSSRRPSERDRQVGSRLRRVGQQILGNQRQRVNSLHR